MITVVRVVGVIRQGVGCVRWRRTKLTPCMLHVATVSTCTLATVDVTTVIPL